MSHSEIKGIGMTSQRTRDRLVARLREKGIHNERVLAQIGDLPRHLFVDEALAHRAYEDTALPIGHGQTISQPFIVALMTQLLLETGPRRVLEVGTGCGYQTAVLANLCRQIFTIERIEALVPRAKERLLRLGIRNVVAKFGDGYKGWEAHGPFDGIIVTAAPAEVPPGLIAQLADGGRLVVPVGGDGSQNLKVIDKRDEVLTERVMDRVRFVPLVNGITQS
jgi:protein-L-isoaspartate(D-aspartate) O-methyltransferase